MRYHPELERALVIVPIETEEDLNPIGSRNLDDDADEDSILEKSVDPGEYVEQGP